MAIRNNALSMYQDQKKKNSLQPYIDAGNASTQPKTEATRVSPTSTPNTVAKAYSARTAMRSPKYCSCRER